jgi:hypothetical protein
MSNTNTVVHMKYDTMVKKVASTIVPQETTVSDMADDGT